MTITRKGELSGAITIKYAVLQERKDLYREEGNNKRLHSKALRWSVHSPNDFAYP